MRPKIDDGFPLTLTRQQRYHLRKRMEGKCIQCGKDTSDSTRKGREGLKRVRCDACQVKANALTMNYSRKETT